MAKYGKGLPGRRENLIGLERQLQQQQKDEQSRLAHMAIGRAVDIPLPETVNSVLRQAGQGAVQYQRSGYIGLLHLQRADVQRAIQAGSGSANVMHHAILQLGGSALEKTTIRRQELQIAAPRPVINNARKEKFWLITPAEQQAEGFELTGDIVDLSNEQANLHEALQIPQTNGPAFVWLGALSAHSMDEARNVLGTLESVIPKQVHAEPVQLLSVSR